MRLLHVAPHYLPAVRYGGPIHSIHGLCRALVELGHEVHVFTTDVDGSSRLDVPLAQPVDIDGVKVWYFPISFPRRIFYSPAMKDALKEQLGQFDFVHLQSTYLWPMWAAARIAKSVGVPYVLTPRGTLVKDLVQGKNRFVKLAWINLIERKTIRQAAFLHVTSAHEAAALGHFHFQLPAVEIIPNGVDCVDADFSERPPEASETKGNTLLFLGRLSWEKGLDRLIPALAHMPKMQLLIAGNDERGYRLSLEALAAQHGVASRVRFLGPVYGSAKERLLHTVSLMILPSYSENFGNVILEAWAMGCPVAVTQEVGLASVVQETGAGVVVPGEPHLLGAALLELLSQPELLKAMGIQGQQIVAERFTWPAIAQQMQAAYMSHRVKGKCSTI